MKNEYGVVRIENGSGGDEHSSGCADRIETGLEMASELFMLWK